MKVIATLPVRFGYRAKDYSFTTKNTFAYIKLVVDRMGRVKIQHFTRTTPEMVSRYGMSQVLPRLDLWILLQLLKELGFELPEIHFEDKEIVVKTVDDKILRPHVKLNMSVEKAIELVSELKEQDACKIARETKAKGEKKSLQKEVTVPKRTESKYMAESHHHCNYCGHICASALEWLKHSNTCNKKPKLPF